ARQDVGGAALRRRRDQADRLVGIVLLRRRRQRERKQHCENGSPHPGLFAAELSTAGIGIAILPSGRLQASAPCCTSARMASSASRPCARSSAPVRTVLRSMNSNRSPAEPSHQVCGTVPACAETKPAASSERSASAGSLKRKNGGPEESATLGLPCR